MKQPIVSIRHLARVQRDAIKFAWFRLTVPSAKNNFECPLCDYIGPFMDVRKSTGLRKHAKCAKCGAFERHRLQFLVFKKIIANKEPSKMKMLHIAPEPWSRRVFGAIFGHYDTADLSMEDVDYNVDMQNMPFADRSYDFVLASNVLDYCLDDDSAIREVSRILRPDGMAMLSVSMTAEKTVDYDKPNAFESGHVRASGLDYFDRCKKHFSKVETTFSRSWPFKYQPYIYEDRSQWTRDRHPHRSNMPGEKHDDSVAVCYV